MIWYVGLLQLVWRPVAAVYYTFTHKHDTEKHNETEYIYRKEHTLHYTTLHNLQNQTEAHKTHNHIYID